ncbi:MAG: Vms1/Ankzf1 family peptidyl-tRNA hydrolase [Methanotrichaceae archaeon]
MKFIRDTKSVTAEDLAPVTDIDLKALAEVQDDMDTVLSVYTTINKRDISFVNSRLKLISKALPENLQKSFEGTLALAESSLSAQPVKGEKGRAIFASASQALLQTYRLGLEIEPLVVWDRSPFLLPLARLSNEYADYWLLLVDSREARLFLVRSNAIVEKGKASIDLMNKHKKGGWSQMRFNRLRKGTIKSFLKEIVDDLQGLVGPAMIKGLVVAGPGDAKNQLIQMLPPSLNNKLLGTLDLSISTLPSELVKLGDDVTQQDNSEKAAAAELKAAILKGMPAAYGFEEVRMALEQGRVKTLVLNNFEIPGMVCQSCRLIPEIQQSSCPSCGGHMSKENIAEQFYELAQRTGAEVALVEDDAFLESIGGMGAMLRY